MRIQPQTINFATDEALAAETPTEAETTEPKTKVEDRSGDSANNDGRQPEIKALNAPVKYIRMDGGPIVGDGNGFGHGGKKLPPVW